jgi:PAS domain S-box-containing protein
MQKNEENIEALAQALEVFTKTTQKMEEAYRRLETRLTDLDRELNEKNRELAVTSDYLNSLLLSMSDGVIAVDTENKVTHFNHASGKILGYDAHNVVGRYFHDVFDRDFDAPKMPGAMELRAKSKRLVPVNERDSIITNHNNEPLGKVKTFQDLSELTALREQVRQIDRLAAIGEMAATVAHEIRNPLGGIRGFATLLAQDIDPDDPRLRMVNKILDGTESLDKVVNELLEYTRPVELELRPCSARETINGALPFLNGQFENIKIKNDINPDLNVLVDPNKMRQVILNILLNAIQSIKENGAINIAASAAASAVFITIQDNGCGMDKLALDQIFSPFYTTKEKGTGLGLAICHKIVEGHGGTIEAQSRPDKGTKIIVRIPQAE